MTGYFGLIELLLMMAIVFGFGFWQLRAVSKSQAEDRAKKQSETTADAASGTAASAERPD